MKRVSASRLDEPRTSRTWAGGHVDALVVKGVSECGGDLAVVFNRGPGKVEDDQRRAGHFPNSRGGAAFGCSDR